MNLEAYNGVFRVPRGVLRAIAIPKDMFLASCRPQGYFASAAHPYPDLEASAPRVSSTSFHYADPLGSVYYWARTQPPCVRRCSSTSASSPAGESKLLPGC